MANMDRLSIFFSFFFFPFFFFQLIQGTSEPGVVSFKVESLQCKVALNPSTLQSLHLKVTPTPGMPQSPVH